MINGDVVKQLKFSWKDLTPINFTKPDFIQYSDFAQSTIINFLNTLNSNLVEDLIEDETLVNTQLDEKLVAQVGKLTLQDILKELAKPKSPYKKLILY